jgi:glutaredoxin 3
MNPVKMYTTAVCPFCIRAKQFLLAKGVEIIDEIRVDMQPQERMRMMQVTGRPRSRRFSSAKPMWAAATT